MRSLLRRFHNLAFYGKWTDCSHWWVSENGWDDYCSECGAQR